ncbi:thioredoxin domain-containing protein [bacterium]|nr:MAG: thioredoxin domain-containing protein [bacterium]
MDRNSSKMDEVNLLPFLTPITIFISAIIIFVGLIVISTKVDKLSGGNLNLTANSQNTTTTAETKTISNEQIDALFERNDLIFMGSKDAKLKIVEISDPSCPYCHIAGGYNPELASQDARFKYDTDGGTYVPPVREIEKLVNEGKAQFVWLYFPGHGAGEVATQVMYCAYDQGKFFEAHNALFTNIAYSVINNEVKNDIALVDKLYALLPTNVVNDSLKECVSSGKYKARLASEQTLSYTFAVGPNFGTPGFFVNYQNFAGAYSWTEMKSAADAAL